MIQCPLFYVFVLHFIVFISVSVAFAYADPGAIVVGQVIDLSGLNDGVARN